MGGTPLPLPSMEAFADAFYDQLSAVETVQIIRPRKVIADSSMHHHLFVQHRDSEDTSEFVNISLERLAWNLLTQMTLKHRERNYALPA